MLALRTWLLLVVSWSALLSTSALASSLTPSVVDEARLIARDAIETVQDDTSDLDERVCPHCVLKRMPDGRQHRNKWQHSWQHKWQHKWQQHGRKKWQHKTKPYKGNKQKAWKQSNSNKGFKAQDDLGDGGSNDKANSDNGSPSSGLAQFSKGKLGLVWAMDQSHMKNFAADHVGWWYDWNAAPGGDDYPKDLTYCSMLWGEKKVQSYIENVVNKPNSEANQHKCTLGMNEPNLGAQSSMSPGRACELQRQYQIPMKEQHGFIVGSPAVANGPAGLKWMQEFQSACPDVFNKLDFVSAHYYDTSFDGFKDWINTLAKFNKPILITELAAYSFSGRPQMDQGGVSNFMKQAVGWAVNNDQILGVGWTGFMNELSSTNKLFSGNGSPNALFQQYLNVGQS